MLKKADALQDFLLEIVFIFVTKSISIFEKRKKLQIIDTAK